MESKTHTADVTLALLEKSEEDQNMDKIEEIAYDIRKDIADFGYADFSDMPRIVVTDDMVIRDGHHRVAGAMAAGIGTLPAIVVKAEHWSGLREQMGFEAAVRAVADEVDDYITWGAV